jgi:hypothetical protein
MKDMKFLGTAAWLEDEEILVLGDLHLGYEEYLNVQGVFLPRTQYKKTIGDLDRIFRKIKGVKEIVILGDLKHEFHMVSRQEWKEVLDFIDYLKEKCEKVVLIKGNHDTILEPLAERKELKIKDYYIRNDLAFLHGHKFFGEILDKKIKRIFLGHLHPAISIWEGVKSEVYKCFLVGKWRKKEIVILPSFFPLTEGVDVNIQNTDLEAEFKLKLESFEVFVPVSVSEVLEFGKVRDVGRLI